MGRQLNLDRDKLDQCYDIAARIVGHAAKYIDRHSSPAVERATLRILGVQGDYRGKAVASLIVEQLTKDQLRLGAAHWWGRALLATKEKPDQLVKKGARGKIAWDQLPKVPPGGIKKETTRLAKEGLAKLSQVGKKGGVRFVNPKSFSPQLAVRFSETRPRKMKALAEDWSKKGAHFTVCHYDSKRLYSEASPPEDFKKGWAGLKDSKTILTTKGLSTPEQLLFGLEEGCGILELEGWRPVLTGEIDAKRGLVDHQFALKLAKNGSTKILNRLVTLSLKPPQHLALLILYEQFAARQEIALENVMLSLAPTEEIRCKSWLHLLAEAQVAREMFPQSILFYVVPEAFNPLHYFIATFTEQDVVEVSSGGKNLEKVQGALKESEGVGKEFNIQTYGKVARHAHAVLDQTWKGLKQIEQMTLWKALEKDSLKVRENGAKELGKETVFQKSYHYWNPVLQLSSGKRG